MKYFAIFNCVFLADAKKPLASRGTRFICRAETRRLARKIAKALNKESEVQR